MAQDNQPIFETPIAQPETGPQTPENPDVFETPKAPEQPVEATPVVPPPAPAQATPVPTVAVKDEVTVRVESVLEADLAETYGHMNEPERRRFKAEGERVTREIVSMIAHFRVKLSRVLKLLTGWLKMIPGVSRFFVVQEAKLKADRILAIVEDEKTKRPLL